VIIQDGAAGVVSGGILGHVGAMLAGVEVGRWTSICSRSGSRWRARRVAAGFAFKGAPGYSRLWGVIEASLARSGADIARAIADAAGAVGLWGVDGPRSDHSMPAPANWAKRRHRGHLSDVTPWSRGEVDQFGDDGPSVGGSCGAGRAVRE
jgi:hypothetical protein